MGCRKRALGLPQDSSTGPLCQVSKLVARSAGNLPDELHAIAIAEGRRDGRRLNAVELSDASRQTHVILPQGHFVQVRTRCRRAKLGERMVLLNQVSVE